MHIFALSCEIHNYACVPYKSLFSFLHYSDSPLLPFTSLHIPSFALVLTSIGRKTAIPLLGATLIAILAFLPIYMSPDVTGLYVRDMFIVLAVSLLLSWILALVFVPLLAKRWLTTQQEQDPQALYNMGRREESYRYVNKKPLL